MTKQEFIAEAKRRGKSYEETRIKFVELDSAGAFTDSIKPQTTEGPQAAVEPEGPKVWTEAGGTLPNIKTLGKHYREAW